MTALKGAPSSTYHAFLEVEVELERTRLARDTDGPRRHVTVRAKI